MVLGLGNPGSEYAETRHNVAWRVLDRVAGRTRAVEGPRSMAYRSRRAENAGRVVHLLQPLTYMNRSGEALLAWREREPDDPDSLLVVTDDVYLPIGRLRVRAGGSSGGHRGLESVEAALGSRGWARLRIGVGAAGDAAELRDQPAVVEFAQAHLHLERVGGRVAQVGVEGVRHHQVHRAIGRGGLQVVAGVERDAEAGDRLAEFDGGVRVFGQRAALGAAGQVDEGGRVPLRQFQDAAFGGAGIGHIFRQMTVEQAQRLRTVERLDFAGFDARDQGLEFALFGGPLGRVGGQGDFASCLDEALHRGEH